MSNGDVRHSFGFGRMWVLGAISGMIVSAVILWCVPISESVLDIKARVDFFVLEREKLHRYIPCFHFALPASKSCTAVSSFILV